MTVDLSLKATREIPFLFMQRLLNDRGDPISGQGVAERFLYVQALALLKTLVGLGNFIARREPDAILSLHMSDRLLKILDM